jgi:hypothetical protein
VGLGFGVFVGRLVGLGFDVFVGSGVFAAEGVSLFLVQNVRANAATMMMPITRPAVR